MTWRRVLRGVYFKTMREYATYILRCSDGSYYVGVTNSIEERLQQHHEGNDPTCYTYTRRPVEIMHVEYFDDIRDAIQREKQIKAWSRKKKEALIQENYAALQQSAKKIWKS